MTGFTADDHRHMAHALRLAERGAWTTRPNPMVGCVLVAGSGEVVGEGWHVQSGGPHAEVVALQAAGDRARGATAYVTLEPCAHTGRTGPCAEALVEAGVARLIAAMRDPFPQVDGAGFARLRAAGIEVASGLMELQARVLNRGFLSRVERGRPWVRVKLGCSLDGRTALANGESKWITGPAARADVMRWRACAGALLTGSGTVLADDPRLTVRLESPATFAVPVRVVLDAGLATIARGNVRDAAAPTLYVHARDTKVPHGFDAPRLAVGRGPDGQLDLHAVLAALGEGGINEIQVEAGATLSGAFLRAGLVDELLLYVAPVLLGERGRPLFDGLGIETMAQRLQLETVETRRVGDDLRLRLRPASPARPQA